MQRQQVFEAINSERAYQDGKWGAIEQHPHEVGGYLTIMRKLLTDAEAAWANSSDDTQALKEIRKVIAVGVACGEQHGLAMRPPRTASDERARSTQRHS